jgi:hypothetical protein
MAKFTQEQIENAATRVNKFVESEVDYRENSKDSLDDTFACLIDGMDSIDCENRLAEHCKENGIDISGVELDSLVDSLLEDATPRSVHQFHFNPGGFVLDSYAWQEHEICLEYIREQIGHDLFDAIPESLFDFYLSGTGLAYVTSDYIAELAVNFGQIESAIRDLKENQ